MDTSDKSLPYEEINSVAAAKHPDKAPHLSEAEIAAIAERLRKGEYLDDHYKDQVFRQAKEYELTYAGKESLGNILADTMGVPLQTLRRFGDPTDMWSSRLVFGDNLQVLKTLFEMKERGELMNADGTPGIRLCYIDPPFATRQEFRGKQKEMAYADKIIGAQFLEFLRKRLVLIRELLADDGSLYVHLDARKAHYVKVLLDEIFGERSFRNEIIWKRTTAHSSARRFGPVHETLLYYARSSNAQWYAQVGPHSEKYLATKYRHEDERGRYRLSDITGAGATKGESGQIWRGFDVAARGRHWMHKPSELDRLDAERLVYWPPDGGFPAYKRYLNEGSGRSLQDVWDDISPINSMAKERIGYPTQKPEALIERIINASSKPGDLVLDCFAGSGTTAVVADRLDRRWIVVDSGKLAIYMTQHRLLSAGSKGFDLCTAGLYDNDLLERLPFREFQSFCLELFGCRPRKHTISDVTMAGLRKGAPVHFFPYKQTDAVMGREYLASLHERIGGKVSGSVCVIAPVSACDPGLFEDIVQLGKVSYFILRVPYSVIEALHDRGFEHIEQPASEEDVNNPLDAYGFDFIELPEVTARRETNGETFKLHIDSFMRGGLDPDDFEKLPDAGRGDLAMVMVDAKYDGALFQISHWRFADELRASAWTLEVPLSDCGERLMVVFVDRHGNEAGEVIVPRAKAKPKLTRAGKGVAKKSVAKKTVSKQTAAKKTGAAAKKAVAKNRTGSKTRAR